MISDDVRDRALNTTVDKGQRASDLLSALESRIRTDSNAFVAIVKILESIPALSHLAHTLQADYQSVMKDEVNVKNESQETSLSDQLHSAQVHKLSDLETGELEFPLCNGMMVIYISYACWGGGGGGWRQWQCDQSCMVSELI